MAPIDRFILIYMPLKTALLVVLFETGILQ